MILVPFFALEMTLFQIALHLRADPQITLLIFCGVILIGLIGYYFSRKLVVLRALHEKNVKKIINFSDGDTGKIVGKVVFAGETLIAPLSKRKCVFYHIIVEHYQYRNRTRYWHKIIEEEEAADVVLSDGTGFAIIDANNSMSYLVPDANYSTSSSKTMTPELQKILDRHKIDSKGFFGFSKTLRCSEGILEKGEIFVVAGEGQWNETKDHNLNLPVPHVLVIVSGKEEKVFLTDDPEASKEPEPEQ